MARLEDGERIYAIGDIHGCASELKELLHKIIADNRASREARAWLIFLGDYIDRGPDSREVLDILCSRLPDGFSCELLMGNHERMLLDALEDPDKMALWLMNGGSKVVESYARAFPDRLRTLWDLSDLSQLLPPQHLTLLQGLKLFTRHGDYFFVHAGVRPGVPLDQQDPYDLVWIRKPFLTHTGPFGARIVHGHTPDDAPVVLDNRICIDTGAVFTGRLTALRLEGADIAFLST